MALQICPKCKELAITWSVYDDDPLTHWVCRNCGYHSFEDETKEKNCPCCETKNFLYMIDDKKKYWWCSNCGKIEDIVNKGN